MFVSPWAAVLVALGVFCGYVLVEFAGIVGYYAGDGYRPASAADGALAFALYQMTVGAALLARLLVRRRHGYRVLHIGLGGFGLHVCYRGPRHGWPVRPQALSAGALAQLVACAMLWSAAAGRVAVRVAVGVAVLNGITSLVEAAWRHAARKRAGSEPLVVAAGS